METIDINSCFSGRDPRQLVHSLPKARTNSAVELRCSKRPEDLCIFRIIQERASRSGQERDVLLRPDGLGDNLGWVGF
jgi:hypothetical protein